MPFKTRDLLARSWQSQVNLSLFLLLLILTAFVLPSVPLWWTSSSARRYSSRINAPLIWATKRGDFLIAGGYRRSPPILESNPERF